ncbi:hypothetical protein FAZ69_30155 [Trinickia terrae]|uniref:Lipoprotein transmembrane n=1 Tax=Trinickia terrae TaxID=2571161 RepID=A0A4U1HMR9_9BURK|nr:hypothetical protein [Trinickia terrae]TKC80076.1 hypothetical protein FAZ69_30155 [Trinickia terrae]
MDSSNTTRRFALFIGRLAACAAGVSIALTNPAFADLVDERNEMINKFITDMHADPLVADCAAHGNFVASTSTAIDHVEFKPESFDSEHATVTPWNDSFDEGKQRVKVDNIVTVEGLGIPHDASQSPFNLKFRCGYVGTQMLAFSWNDPVPPAKPRAEPQVKKAVKGKHAGKSSTKKKSTGKGSSKAAASKSTAKKTATPNKSSQKNSTSSSKKSSKTKQT